MQPPRHLPSSGAIELVDQGVDVLAAEGDRTLVVVLVLDAQHLPPVPGAGVEVDDDVGAVPGAENPAWTWLDSQLLVPRLDVLELVILQRDILDRAAGFLDDGLGHLWGLSLP